MNIEKTEAGTIKDQTEKGQDPGPPDDGDIATPKSQPPSDDDKPLE